MALIPILSSIDALPEDVKSHYKKNEAGKFILDITPTEGFSLEDVSGLKSTLGKYKEADRIQKQQLAAFGELDPQAAKDAIERLEEYKNFNPSDKVQELVESNRKKLEGKYKGILTDKDSKYQALFGEYKKQVVDNALAAEIRKAGGVDELLVPLVRDRVKLIEDSGKFLVQVLDKNGDLAIGDGGDNLTIEGMVTSLKTQEPYSRLFEGKKQSGSGSNDLPPIFTQGRGSQSKISPPGKKAYIPKEQASRNIDAIARGEATTIKQ